MKQSDSRGRPRRATGRSLALVLVALVIGYWVYRTGPTTETKKEDRPARIVQTVTPQPASVRIHVVAQGSVIPARRVVVEPQVSGHVVRQHTALRPGGFLKAGEELYAIDPKLAGLDLAEAEADVARVEAGLAEANRRLDEGRQLADESVIPATELASLETTRRVQEAELQRLRPRRQRALELLERHVVKVPFNAVVLDEAVEIGQRVTPGDATVTLVGTDQFWVRASVPTDKLSWIRLPAADRPGAPADVVLDGGAGEPVRYPGSVVQLLGDLTEIGRMARVLVQVEDPLGLQPGADRPPLLLGSYARIEIDAGELPDVLTLSRGSLREGDRIWIVDTDQRLQIRNVEVLWSAGDTVLINAALAPGERLIVSDLRVALPGMEVQAQSTAEGPADPSDVSPATTP